MQWGGVGGRLRTNEAACPGARAADTRVLPLSIAASEPLSTPSTCPPLALLSPRSPLTRPPKTRLPAGRWGWARSWRRRRAATQTRRRLRDGAPTRRPSGGWVGGLVHGEGVQRDGQCVRRAGRCVRRGLMFLAHADGCGTTLWLWDHPCCCGTTLVATLRYLLVPCVRSTNATVQNTFTLDLHGQHVDEALASLERCAPSLSFTGCAGTACAAAPGMGCKSGLHIRAAR